MNLAPMSGMETMKKDGDEMSLGLRQDPLRTLTGEI